MVHVKICGVTSVADALACAELGATAIGVNFVPSSPRRVNVERAREIARAVSIRVVGVVADLDLEAMQRLKDEAELDALQLHGDESPATLLALLPHAYKAVRIGGPADVVHARTFSGDEILVDARTEGALGGTGKSFDWSLVRELAGERKLTLAGGLRPDNVAEAVRAVAPYCVDVASGVEKAAGVKDLDAVRAFVIAATRAR